MKRIWITGSSGSGKTTLANQLGDILGIEVYHSDQVSWMENWELRPNEEQNRIIRQMTEKESWIFEGNKFTNSKVDGRFERCDTLIHLNINRLVCLYCGLKRYVRHRKIPRKQLPSGCPEEYDWKIIKYVLFDYPLKSKERKTLFNKLENDGKQVLVFNSTKEKDDWLKRRFH